MNALTIAQPYALAVMLGIKRVENRTWYSRHRGPLLIHAGKSKQWLGSYDQAQEDAMESAGIRFNHPDPIFTAYREIDADALTFGAILGVVEQTQCLTLAEYKRLRPDDIWAFGPHCHVYERPRLFPTPIPYRGAQGYFDVPDELIREEMENLNP